MAVSPQGDLYAIVESYGVDIWTIDRQTRVIAGAGDNIATMKFAPDGKALFVLYQTGFVSKYDAKTGVMTWGGNFGSVKWSPIYSAEFSDDCRSVSFVRASEVIHYDVQTRCVSQRRFKIPRPDRMVAWSTDLSTIAHTIDANTISIKRRTGRQRKIRDVDIHVSLLSLTHDGSLLAASTTYGDLRIWEMDGLTCKHIFHAHCPSVYRIFFSPDATVLALHAYGGGFAIWRLGNKERVLHAVAPFRSRRMTLAFMPDGERMIGHTDERKIIFYPVPEPEFSDDDQHALWGGIKSAAKTS